MVLELVIYNLECYNMESTIRDGCLYVKAEYVATCMFQKCGAIKHFPANDFFANDWILFKVHINPLGMPHL